MIKYVVEWMCVIFKLNEVGINLPRMDYEVNSNTIAKVHRPKAIYILEVSCTME